jgi:alkanesulfonate monooxygenase
MRPLEFGWFLPTSGDTTAYGDPSQAVQPSLEMFDRVTRAAEDAGFTYLLLPVDTSCWEAWIAGAMMVARSRSIAPLIAARPGYIAPVQMAKMVATFDQLSGGRIRINLIAGQSEQQIEGDGIRLGKDDRYALMDEEVTILKALWTAPGAIDFEGRFHTLKRSLVRPRILQKPYPRFYLGGGSRQAWEVSAKHADVHLFWGDHPDRIAANMADIRGMAEALGRSIAFGMRLQIICREREADAWEAAEALVRGVSEQHVRMIHTTYGTSVANQRMQALSRTPGEKILPHLWTGITRVRPGAGVAVVGNPEQCAATLQHFIDIGCESFCLSGYLHDAEAERFGRLVMPILRANNAGWM